VSASRDLPRSPRTDPSTTDGELTVAVGARLDLDSPDRAMLTPTVAVVGAEELQPRAIPEATVARLAVYLRVIGNLLEDGQDIISSEELARTAGVNSAKLRKDLSFLGSFGTRGVGYDLTTLRDRIAEVLGVSEKRGVVIVGVGNLGHALAGYGGFASRGFHVAGLFDSDQLRVGERIGEQYVRPMSELADVVAVGDVAIGIIATPTGGAQNVADALVSAGVTSILNFAPVVLSVPTGIDVRKVDLASELQILSFHERRKAGLPRPHVEAGGAS